MIPPGLQAYAARGPEWADWLDRLPALARDLLDDWSLTPDGEATHGRTALVAPVRTTAGRPAVLKVGWPHVESELEALALQHWHGRGAVPLLKADPRRWALLLERLDPEDLSDLGDVQACEVVAGLYGRLHVPAPPQLRLLSDVAGRWAEQLRGVRRGGPIPPRMLEHAASLARDLAADEATDGRLLHTDLHYGNVLARGEEWLAIDPKPLSGDPHAELAPMLWNRFDELAGRVREGVRDRFFALVDTAGLDEDRARAWVIVRMMAFALERLEDPSGTVREMSDHDFFTMCVAVVKAVQD